MREKKQTRRRNAKPADINSKPRGQVVGVDFGYGFTKIVREDGQRIMFPSVVAAIAPDEVAALAAVHDVLKLAAGDVVVAAVAPDLVVLVGQASEPVDADLAMEICQASCSFGCPGRARREKPLQTRCAVLSRARRIGGCALTTCYDLPGRFCGIAEFVA